MSRYDFTRNALIQFATSADESVLDVMPTGSRNTLHWHLGHVLVVTEKFLFNYPENTTNIPKSYGALFNPGTSPADWPADGVPSVTDIIGHLENQLKRINHLTDADLAKDIPFEFLNFKTVADLYDVAIHHEAEHLGQIKAMKRTVEAEA